MREPVESGRNQLCSPYRHRRLLERRKRRTKQQTKKKKKRKKKGKEKKKEKKEKRCAMPWANSWLFKVEGEAQSQDVAVALAWQPRPGLGTDGPQLP